MCWLAAHVRAYQRLWGLPETGEHERVPAGAPGPGPLTWGAPVVAPCAHLGSREPGQPCGSPLLRCALHGDLTTRFAACSGAQRCCARCPDYCSAVAPLRPGDPGVGLAIGSYKWPELVELQIRVARATCGPVPVLVSTDHPEGVPALAAVCDRYPDVYLWPNATRLGHTGGDLAVYWKGVMWGAARGLEVVAKVSQRMVFTGAYWLQDGARELLASGLPVASRASSGAPRWPLRTEAALLDVGAWHRPGVLGRCAPGAYWGRRDGGFPAEAAVLELVRELLGGVYWPWPALPVDRRAGGAFLWHESHAADEYRALAARFGVALPGDFHTGGWDQEYRDGVYSYG
ncbi:hypothetical protein [Gemmata sp. SH-PL17]|uniref:hypothetical protein n=1 Tax=Gemmata sp. SH-PL17 TaxID=1630693 RepID=UPI0012FB33C1|nr:hypothetical protein [Gemmata sp. SH-PL17]